ncbi:MAG: ATP-dependent zinc protease [Phycisphaerae bacterium]|nr:ATP-dependent zinc protease [Phycisphaerae bacterium]
MIRLVFVVAAVVGVWFTGCAPPAAVDAAAGSSAGGNETNLPVGIIGQVEPIVVYPARIVLEARIDTGATTSSIDSYNDAVFERDGRRWVRFYLLDRKTKKKHKFERPVVRFVRIVEHGKKNTKRPVVTLTISMGKVVLKRQFTLANRHNFAYQMLVGRNVLNGQAAVDVSVSRTLRPEIVNGD